MLSELRLYQLISPALPVGAFTYSQGLEWAIECGWVTTPDQLEAWLGSVLHHSVATLEVPVLARMLKATTEQDQTAFEHWGAVLHASRETRELRAEELQRGQALARLLPELGIEIPDALRHSVESSQLAGMALAAQVWEIDIRTLARGYLWSWLENAVMAGVKLVPLGQTAGQKILLNLSDQIPELLTTALELADADVGSSTPAMAIASSLHETQYTRLFRS